MYRASRVRVRSIDAQSTIKEAVLKDWERHGEQGQQVCLHLETDYGDSIREIADWRDTINPAYATFQMPSLSKNDVEIHGSLDLQHYPESGRVKDANAVDQQVFLYYLYL